MVKFECECGSRILERRFCREISQFVLAADEDGVLLGDHTYDGENRRIEFRCAGCHKLILDASGDPIVKDTDLLEYLARQPDLEESEQEVELLIVVRNPKHRSYLDDWVGDLERIIGREAVDVSVIGREAVDVLFHVPENQAEHFEKLVLDLEYVANVSARKIDTND